MANATPDGLPPQSVEHIARFLVVSAHEDRALIRRTRPAAPDDFLNRVRHLPAMLFTNTPNPNARARNAAPGQAPRGQAPLGKAPAGNAPLGNTQGVTRFRRPTLPPLVADDSVLDTGPRGASPRARAAAERLELAIEAADRSEQSLAAMQFALDRAHRRNLVFGVATCVVVAVSLGTVTVGRSYIGGREPAPEVVASAATPAVASTLPVPPLPQGSPAPSAASSLAPSLGASRSATPPFGPAHASPAQTELGTPALAFNTPATGASEDGLPSMDAAQDLGSQGADPTQPRLIDASADNASALLRTLPPGSIIVSPLPEPPAALQAEEPDLSSVQPVSVTSTATVEALPPRHHYAVRRTRPYAYRPYYRPYSPINRLPEQVGRLVDNLGRNIRSLF
jgi:hypothetical protein